VLRGVNFDFDKAEIRHDAAVILDEAVSIPLWQAGCPGADRGTHDSTGPTPTTRAFPERRANSVRKYMEQHGNAASRLTGVGFGEAKPLSSNDTREGRALNRRVELQVLE
jgi:OOP family OmpA-OmpF porin